MRALQTSPHPPADEPAVEGRALARRYDPPPREGKFSSVVSTTLLPKPLKLDEDRE